MTSLHKLTSTQVKSLPVGKYSDGGGLWLHKRPDGGAQWVLRVAIHGRRREMGLGGVRNIDHSPELGLTLKEVRQEATKWRSVLRDGKDPIKERQLLKRDAAREDQSLATVAAEAFEARKAELKGDGKDGRWFSPLEIHVLPKLGKVPFEDIDLQDIGNTLAPIWHTKADTARKAMNRLNLVLKYGAALGLNVDLQAPDKAKALLGKSRHVPKHIPAMPWKEVPAYVRFPLSLRNVEDLLHERGIEISHETVRFWWNRFGPMFAAEIRRNRVSRLRAFSNWQWHLDEVFVKINGERHYLWRAVDHEGEVLESYVT